MEILNQCRVHVLSAAQTASRDTGPFTFRDLLTGRSPAYAVAHSPVALFPPSQLQARFGCLTGRTSISSSFLRKCLRVLTLDRYSALFGRLEKSKTFCRAIHLHLRITEFLGQPNRLYLYWTDQGVLP